MRSFNVVTIGSATLDVFLHCQSLMVEKENGLKEICIPYGAKIEVEEILFETGGGGTNSAVTFARQGLKTAVVAKTGFDFAAEKIINGLKKERVSTEFIIKDKKESTDYSTILWAADGGRTILVSRGKTRLQVKEIPWSRIKTNWFYISSIEGNLEIMFQIIRSRLQAKIAWNPGKRELEQRDKVLNLLPQVEVLLLNKEEAKELLTMEQWNNGTMEDILKKAQKLLSHFIIITDGANGSYCWDGKNWWYTGTYQVRARETTGAGDAYGSGFVSGLIKGFSFKDCLRLAAANATSVISLPGAKKGILESQQIDGWLKKKLRIKKFF